MGTLNQIPDEAGFSEQQAPEIIAFEKISLAV